MAIFSRSNETGVSAGAREGELGSSERIPFCKASERPPDSHDFPDGFHLRSERGVRSGKFFKLPLRNFHDHIVDCRLK